MFFGDLYRISERLLFQNGGDASSKPSSGPDFDVPNAPRTPAGPQHVRPMAEHGEHRTAADVLTKLGCDDSGSSLEQPRIVPCEQAKALAALLGSGAVLIVKTLRNIHEVQQSTNLPPTSRLAVGGESGESARRQSNAHATRAGSSRQPRCVAHIGEPDMAGDAGTCESGTGSANGINTGRPLPRVVCGCATKQLAQ